MSKMARAEERSAFGRFRSGFGDSIPRQFEGIDCAQWKRGHGGGEWLCRYWFSNITRFRVLECFFDLVSYGNVAECAIVFYSHNQLGRRIQAHNSHRLVVSLTPSFSA